MCMMELPELFTEMGKLYFNKSDSLQEKRQHIYIRSAVHDVYLTSTFLASSDIRQLIHLSLLWGPPSDLKVHRPSSGFL